MSDDNNRTLMFLGAALRGTLAGLALALMFAAGFLVRDLVGAPTVRAQDEYPVLNEVVGLLSQHYVRPLPDAKALEYGAIRGMIGVLNDPHTFFIDPPVAQNESDALAGEYGGIGVELQRDSVGDYVLYPYPDGPAIAAGIEDGDRLLAVDGASITPDMPHDAVQRLLRGDVGKRISVTVQHRDGATETFEIELALIEVPSVLWSTVTEEPSFGYIRLLRFTSRTPEELEQALTELIEEQEVVALILDVRHNSGGLLQEAIDVASQFLDGGVVLYEEKRDTDREPKEASGGGLALDTPMVVLVDGASASAAELVAGALQDRGRAILIGQKTYGKGSVQWIFKLSDGSSLHVTVSEWFTPSGAMLDGMGLTPDIEMIHATDFDAELGEAIRYLLAQVGVPQ
ncbi:MAG: S41 family peptidase [Anaerolineae bacterium]|nr:S41 family peptidase [Anaerolineae bacterium]